MRSNSLNRIARAALILAAALALLLEGCTSGAAQTGARLTGGDAQRGRAAIGRYGCGSCHTIQGIADARGLVGPPLTGIGNRLYVAGVVPNTAANIVHWIRNPRQLNEKTAMPVLGVSARDATDIAAYLYSTK